MNTYVYTLANVHHTGTNRILMFSVAVQVSEELFPVGSAHDHEVEASVRQVAVLRLSVGGHTAARGRTSVRSHRYELALHRPPVALQVIFSLVCREH